MKIRYILAIDQGTSATKGVLFDEQGGLVGRHNESHRQFYPKPGWVEHDPEEIYKNTVKAIKGVLNDTGVLPCDVAAIAISNQRETAIVWDGVTGKPIYNAIVWQCGRGAGICSLLEKQGFEATVRDKTGLILSPFFSAAKIKWILDNVKGAREKAKHGQLKCGTVDSWLIYRLTEGVEHATDYSNASRTQLFNIKTLKWDNGLLDIFTIPLTMLPEVKSSDAIFGYTDCEGFFDKPVPIAGVLGDSHAALFGQNCFDKGMVKVTYGTGSSIMMNIGEDYIKSKKGLVTSLAWAIGGRVEYVFEGNINFSGATIKWLVDELELISDPKEAGGLASSVNDNGGVYLVPAFTGLSAPYWDNDSRALITGLTRGTKKAHVVRAAEESIAYQVKDIVDLMAEESGIASKELRVDGGPTRDDFLMQFQSDMLSTRVIRNKIEEISAAGAAYMSGLALGFWRNKKELETLRSDDKIFYNSMDSMQTTALYKGWKSAVERTMFKA